VTSRHSSTHKVYNRAQVVEEARWDLRVGPRADERSRGKRGIFAGREVPWRDQLRLRCNDLFRALLIGNSFRGCFEGVERWIRSIKLRLLE